MNERVPFNYFDAFQKQVLCSQDMVLKLAPAISAGKLGNRELMTSLHVIEHKADEVNHEIQNHLLTDFVTSMENSSITALSHCIDDVCDGVEQIAIEAYMLCFDQEGRDLPAGTHDLMLLMEEGIANLCAAVGLLHSLDRNHDEIRKYCVGVQSCESRADEIYIESVRSLYEDSNLTGETRRIYQDLLTVFEDAMDAMENAAECLEAIILESM